MLGLEGNRMIEARMTRMPHLPFLVDSFANYQIYYNTAANVANYGSYSRNSNKKDSADYVYEVPKGWKERLVSKAKKGTDRMDSKFFNLKKKLEKEYLTFLLGFRQLAPKDTILNNLMLLEVDLQDLIANMESLMSEEEKDENGQIYYMYVINGVGNHSLISMRCMKNKLYAHFVNALMLEWNKDKEILKHVHESFKTVGSY